jgi:hypothetical protein
MFNELESSCDCIEPVQMTEVHVKSKLSQMQRYICMEVSLVHV